MATLRPSESSPLVKGIAAVALLGALLVSDGYVITTPLFLPRAHPRVNLTIYRFIGWSTQRSQRSGGRYCREISNQSYSYSRGWQVGRQRVDTRVKKVGERLEGRKTGVPSLLLLMRDCMSTRYFCLLPNAVRGGALPPEEESGASKRMNSGP